MPERHEDGGLLGRARYGGLLAVGQRLRSHGDADEADIASAPGEGCRCLGGETFATRLEREWRGESDDDAQFDFFNK